MTQEHELFTPQAVDEQIEQLARASHALPPGREQPAERQLIQHLQHLYETDKADERSIETVWERLARQNSAARPPQRSHPGPPSGRTLPQESQRFPQAPLPPPRARRGWSYRLAALVAAVLLVVVISGLVAGLVLVRRTPQNSTSSATVTPGAATATPIPATSTPVPAPCATRPAATAEAWYPDLVGPDYVHGQLMGTINNGPVMTLSDFHFPLNVPGGDYSKAIAPGYMLWSPDARYLAVSMPVQVPVPGSNYPRDVSYPYLVDPRTHATTLISVSSSTDAWNSGRSLAWADNHTLLLFYGGNTMNGSPGATYSYDVTNKTLRLLPEIKHAAEGVVRCSTLFYLELTPLTQKIGEANGVSYYRGLARLHRYDLVTQQEIGQPVTLGATYVEQEYPYAPAWDVSPDGTRIVYQQTDTSGVALITRQFLVSNADGSHSTPIFSQVRNITFLDFAVLVFSPDGQMVAMIGDQNDAACYTSHLDGSAFHKYGGNHLVAVYTSEIPAWLPDSSGFDLVTALPSGQSLGDPFISRFLLTTSPGPDGLVPGTTQIQEAQDVTILS